MSAGLCAGGPPEESALFTLLLVVDAARDFDKRGESKYIIIVLTLIYLKFFKFFEIL